MIDDSVQPTVAALETVLLEAKLAVPVGRSGAVRRDELIRTVRDSGCRVVAITAPAGYGKSTLLAQWAEVEGRLVGWIFLDRLDDDPSALLAVLEAAFARICSDNQLISGVTGLGLSALGPAAHAWPRPCGQARSRSSSCSTTATRSSLRTATTCSRWCFRASLPAPRWWRQPIDAAAPGPAPNGW